MSGLYNMLVPQHPYSPYLLLAAGITQETKDKYPLGRFRDTWVDEDCGMIGILTRNGSSSMGLPRQEQERINLALSKNPNFVRQYSEKADRTYHSYIFSVPENYLEPVRRIVEVCQEHGLNVTTPRMALYMRIIHDLGQGKATPDTANALEAGKKIVEQIQNAVKHGHQGGTVRHGGSDITILNLDPVDPETN